jgi:hypothetical protein
MKSLITASALVLGGLAMPAAAATPIDLFLQNTNGADGFVDLTDSNSFTLWGGQTNNGAFTYMRGTADMDFTLSGNWFYETFDVDGPSYDPAGYFINSSIVFLTDNSGGNIQSGTFSLLLATGDSFGFFVQTTDGCCGRGSLAISDLSRPYVFGGDISTGAVPEPESWALLIAGFGLVGAVMRRRRMAPATA